MEKGVPIRSISRCIAVLQAINRAGDLSLMEIAKRAKVPYPTACRIVQTLLHEKLIEREPSRKHYRPTPLIQSLSNGFQIRSQLVAVARDHIVGLTSRHGWPVSLATRVGQSMVIRDSTHALTSQTFNNYYPGYMLPILECAAGKAYLAYADDAEREMIVREIRANGDAADPLTMRALESGDLIESIREVGYAVKGRNRHTETPGKTSSIARPIFGADGVVGSIVLIFFSSAMKIDDAVAKYDDDLRRTAEQISHDLIAAQREAAAGHIPEYPVSAARGLDVDIEDDLSASIAEASPPSRTGAPQRASFEAHGVL
jgi:IclR family mhp operon transcriptional activator